MKQKQDRIIVNAIDKTPRPRTIKMKGELIVIANQYFKQVDAVLLLKTRCPVNAIP